MNGPVSKLARCAIYVTSSDLPAALKGVDFSRYSKVRNPKLKRYNFGFAQLLEP